MELNKLPINLIPIASERVFIRWPGGNNKYVSNERKNAVKKNLINVLVKEKKKKKKYE